MKAPSRGQIAARLVLVVVACWATGAGLTGFATRALMQLGLFPSEAVLAGTLLGLLSLPAVIVWGLAARRPVIFGLVTIVGSRLLGLLSKVL